MISWVSIVRLFSEFNHKLFVFLFASCLSNAFISLCSTSFSWFTTILYTNRIQIFSAHGTEEQDFESKFSQRNWGLYPILFCTKSQTFLALTFSTAFNCAWIASTLVLGFRTSCALVPQQKTLPPRLIKCFGWFSSDLCKVFDYCALNEIRSWLRRWCRPLLPFIS